MQGPLVSIIINTTGRNLNNLRRLLNSLVKQRFYDFEVIIACETNVDFIRSLCKEYRFKCRIIQTGFWNRCRTANIAIKMARGKYIALLEDDLVLDKSWLESMIKVLTNPPNGNIMCVYSFVVNPLGSESLIYKVNKNFLKELIRYANILRIHNSIKRKSIVVFSLAFICNKDVLFKVGLFDPIPEEPIVGEDYDLAIRINKLGYKIVVVKEAIAYHYSRHYSQRISFIVEKKYSLWSTLISNEIYFFAKHIDIFGIAILMHVIFKIFFEPLNVAYRLKLNPYDLFKVFLYSFNGAITGLIKGIMTSSIVSSLRKCARILL